MKAFQWLKHLFLRRSSKAVSTASEQPNAKETRHEPEAEFVPPHNPTAHAFAESFAPRHGAEEQTVFQSIPPDGVLTEKNEEWFQSGNGQHSVTKKGFIVTCSGDVVSAEQIKARCLTCGGFDSVVLRCSICNITLCRLHAYPLELPSGPALLCIVHYKTSLHNLDTWALHDRAKNKSSNTP